MIIISEAPIDPSRVFGSIATLSAGSIVFHYAVVKANSGNGKTTDYIDYQAGAGVEEELSNIEAHIKAQWTIDDMLIIRRIGCLAVGEIISLVAASSPNSEDAFEACKHGIGRLKKMSTITKMEKFSKIT